MSHTHVPECPAILATRVSKQHRSAGKESHGEGPAFLKTNILVFQCCTRWRKRACQVYRYFKHVRQGGTGCVEFANRKCTIWLGMPARQNWAT